MKRITPKMISHRPARQRRGVTLVEMLVTVAILVIMMTVLVQVFQAATGAVSGAQAFQQIDDQLRRIDGMLRSDLEGATARFTPPLDPALNLGYFEYGENEFADLQGEDSDDYVRFTAKAPEGRPFTGRMWVNNWSNGTTGQIFQQNGKNLASFPVTVTSDYAEIIYFLRNGNLYRRVLLVAPQLQSAIAPSISNLWYYTVNGVVQTPVAFSPTALGNLNVSWQGVNDLSARPAASGPDLNLTGSNTLAQANQTIVLNTLGDLTNRENRFAYQRFSGDFVVNSNTGTHSPDGLTDDSNEDNVPDLYPSLYPNMVLNGVGSLIFAPNGYSTPAGYQTLAFPFVFPGAYTRPQTFSKAVDYQQYGWIHTPTPGIAFDSNALTYLQTMNHNPLDLGDNLPPPSTANGFEQTWWGFPTWRETLPATWVDPTVQVNVNYWNNNLTQPAGLTQRSSAIVPVKDDIDLLPPMVQPASTWPAADNFQLIRKSPQLFADGFGEQSAFIGGTGATQYPLWSQSWEDDLILTGVRSFDIKALDGALGAYVDLGWGDDPRVTGNNATPYLAGNTNQYPGGSAYPAYAAVNGSYFDLLAQTFAHEGRMPPLINDYRFDAQFGYATNYLPSNSTYLSSYSGNIGDNDPNNVGVVRLRRVWDSWSTEYSRAPGNATNNTTGFPVGPPFSPPVYPSYPPPYPAPLRSIQIQVRVVDPTNQRIKSLTIRQDFTDKL